MNFPLPCYVLLFEYSDLFTRFSFSATTIGEASHKQAPVNIYIHACRPNIEIQTKRDYLAVVNKTFISNYLFSDTV